MARPRRCSGEKGSYTLSTTHGTAGTGAEEQGAAGSCAPGQRRVSRPEHLQNSVWAADLALKNAAEHLQGAHWAMRDKMRRIELALDAARHLRVAHVARWEMMRQNAPARHPPRGCRRRTQYPASCTPAAPRTRPSAREGCRAPGRRTVARNPAPYTCSRSGKSATPRNSTNRNACPEHDR